MLFAIFFILCIPYNFQVFAKITVQEYASLPPLFIVSDFDQCLLIHENGLYCYLEIQLHPTSSNHSETWSTIEELLANKKNYRHDLLRHYICVQETCPEITVNKTVHTDYKYVLENALSQCYTNKYLHLGLNATTKMSICQTKDPVYPLDIYDYSVAIWFALLFLMIVMGSFYEGLARYKSTEDYKEITKTTFGRILCCFSIPKNWERLSSPNTGTDAQALRVINGMRVHSILLVIFAHTVLSTAMSPVMNPQYFENMLDNPINMLFMNGKPMIQVFLLLSGWLLCYNFLLHFNQRSQIKVGEVIFAFINRYIRLTPCLAVVIAINSTWVHHLTAAPVWDKAVGTEYRNCRKNWWTNILYINNYYDTDHMCMLHSWYLAVDTQLYIYSIFITILIWKYEKYVKLILGTSFGIGILIPGIINYISNYDIVIRAYPEITYRVYEGQKEFHNIFIVGHTNIVGCTMGIMFGYIFYKYRGKKLFTNKIYVTVWWILVWTLPLSMIYLGILFYQDDYEYTRLGAAFYVALSSPIYTLGIGLLTFGVSQGIGWFLRDCIIWTPFQILGRLTYCVYLVHVIVARVRLGQTKMLFYLSSYNILMILMSDVALSYICGLLLCLFVELPTSALQKLLIPQGKKKVDLVKTEKPTNSGVDIISTKI